MLWFRCCKLLNCASKSFIDSLVCKALQNFCIKVKFKHLFSFPITVSKGSLCVKFLFSFILPSPLLLPPPFLFSLFLFYFCFFYLLLQFLGIELGAFHFYMMGKHSTTIFLVLEFFAFVKYRETKRNFQYLKEMTPIFVLPNNTVTSLI